MMKFLVSFFIFAFLSINSYSSIQLSAECMEGSFYGKSLYYKLVTNNNDYTISVGFGVSDTFTPSTFLRIFFSESTCSESNIVGYSAIGSTYFITVFEKDYGPTILYFDFALLTDVDGAGSDGIVRTLEQSIEFYGYFGELSSDFTFSTDMDAVSGHPFSNVAIADLHQYYTIGNSTNDCYYKWETTDDVNFTTTFELNGGGECPFELNASDGSVYQA
ncbi:MAG: hypothetical protein VXX85_00235, partial [Candidatus Margulisiibacteriota bacterium]|nr:hypothetical protein [Candidatus Margulisiibacteriota bacterium]